MIVKDYTSHKDIKINRDTSIKEAKEMIACVPWKYIPAVVDDQLLGLLSVDDIMQAAEDSKITDIYLEENFQFGQEEDHLLELMEKWVNPRAQFIAILDENKKYRGVVTALTLLSQLGTNFSLRDHGAIIVLTMAKNDYHLSKIVHIIEQEAAQVLVSFVSSTQDSHQIYVTLKVNSNEILRVIKALERHEFFVLASYTDDKFGHDVRDRYDNLMMYLDV